jgi:hypothetical protein
MKKILSTIVFCILVITCVAQAINADKTALTNFLIRMYKHAPLIDVISDWMVRNTVDGSFNLSSNTEMRAKYEQEGWNTLANRFGRIDIGYKRERAFKFGSSSK